MNQINNRNNLKESVSKYVTELFNAKLPDWAVYHDLWHTIETVKGCEEIGRASFLSEEDLEILYIAAWFHDTGYIFQADEHEEKSSEIALEFLIANNYQKTNTDKVIACIMATKISNQPQTLSESVICDADLISLGKDDYLEKNNLLKREVEMRENKKISELEWLKRSLNFLLSYKYYTEYARNHYDNQLKTNIRNLEQMMKSYN
jgi:predicted metal-dependent HD superfamily phosphohydrolase